MGAQEVRMSMVKRMIVTLSLLLGMVTGGACGDKPNGQGPHGGSADGTMSDTATADGGAANKDLAGGADLGVKGALALKLEHEAITEGGYQGTNTILEITAGKQLICSNKFYCTKTCAIPLADADYQRLLKAVQTSGFMKTANKSKHCVDDMGYDRLTVWISSDGGVAKAVYEGQTLSCPSIDAAVKTVYQALSDLALKVIPKSGCN